jgi:hypothetical protein
MTRPLAGSTLVAIVAGSLALALASTRASSAGAADERVIIPISRAARGAAGTPPTDAPSTVRAAGPEAFAAFGGTPYTVGPVLLATTTSPEGEEEVAVDPANANYLVAAISDFSLRGGSNTTKYASSSDGGSSWDESFVPLVNGEPATGDGHVWPYNSDPVVAIDLSGNVYLSDLYFHDEGGDQSNGLYVSVAPFIAGSGPAFTAAATYPVAVNPDPSTAAFEDKPWLAVDHSSTATSGNVYVSWTHFVGNTTNWIQLSVSTDHGHTWSAPLQISPASQNGGVQGSQVAVGPSGEVYVVYEVFYIGGKRGQFLAKSTDAGRTFSQPTPITPLFNELSFHSTYRKSSFAALAVSATDGSVHVAYCDQPNKSSALEYVRSTDGGSTFSAPVRLNDVPSGQRFMPALAADELGVLHASWFDTRNAGRSTGSYDIYAARSTDGGGTWTHNARVTPSLESAGGTSFLGDYSGIAAGGHVAHPVWTSGGSGRLATAALR